MARFFLAAVLLALSCASAAASTQFPLPQLDKLERALNLTPDQKAQYDVAVGATKRMMLGIALAGMQVKEKLQQEFAKPRPDFGALADLRDSVVEQSRPLRREARDEWLKLYAMLNDDQVATIKDFVEQKGDNLGLLHDFMTGLILGRR